MTLTGPIGPGELTSKLLFVSWLSRAHGASLPTLPSASLLRSSYHASATPAGPVPSKAWP